MFVGTAVYLESFTISVFLLLLLSTIDLFFLASISLLFALFIFLSFFSLYFYFFYYLHLFFHLHHLYSYHLCLHLFYYYYHLYLLFVCYLLANWSSLETRIDRVVRMVVQKKVCASGANIVGAINLSLTYFYSRSLSISWLN